MEDIPCAFIYRIALAALLTEFSTIQALVTSSFIEKEGEEVHKSLEHVSWLYLFCYLIHKYGGDVLRGYRSLERVIVPELISSR